MNHAVLSIKSEELEAARIASLSRLWMQVWPGEKSTLADYIERYATRTRERPDRQIHAIFEGDRAIAVAETFSRIVQSAEGAFFVMALAAVCSDPKRRGEGLGALVTKAAFARVDEGAFMVSLFQTPVPAFYERLNCRLVDNAFRNSLHPDNPEKNPFWDPYTMIYPAHAAWPAGPIDLKGPGY